jgi:hypothetical protein
MLHPASYPRFTPLAWQPTEELLPEYSRRSRSETAGKHAVNVSITFDLSIKGHFTLSMTASSPPTEGGGEKKPRHRVTLCQINKACSLGHEGWYVGSYKEGLNLIP